MDRRPGKRRLTWFGKNHAGAAKVPNTPTSNSPKSPNTLGKMWQRERHSREGVDTWPPLPQRDRFAARRADDERYIDQFNDQYTGQYEDAYPDEQAGPIWGQPATPQERPHDGRLRTLWRRFTITARRRPRLLLAGVASTFVLCTMFSVVALGNAFLNSAPNSARQPLATGNANGVLLPTSGPATASATTTTIAAPANTPPPIRLTIAFTCASGVSGGTGQLCVHTVPHSALSLTVRYCDGSSAKGKAFHGVTTADGSGNYTWRWSVTTTCVGVATATVTVEAAGQTVTQQTTFMVTR
jgi:hypothetical protein